MPKRNYLSIWANWWHRFGLCWRFRNKRTASGHGEYERRCRDTRGCVFYHCSFSAMSTLLDFSFFCYGNCILWHLNSRYGPGIAANTCVVTMNNIRLYEYGIYIYGARTRPRPTPWSYIYTDCTVYTFLRLSFPYFLFSRQPNEKWRSYDLFAVGILLCCHEFTLYTLLTIHVDVWAVVESWQYFFRWHLTKKSDETVYNKLYFNHITWYCREKSFMKFRLKSF